VKQALRAAAQFANVDINQASATVRINPILGEEIHIDEELINLEEALAVSITANESLKGYPKVHRHIVLEQRLMLKHCIGQITRMLQGKRLPRKYSKKDTEYALSKLIQILVNEALRVGKHIDQEVLESVRPFLTLKQRKELGEWSSFSPRVYLQMAHHKVTSIWQAG
jgi:hypothetical protein